MRQKFLFLTLGVLTIMQQGLNAYHYVLALEPGDAFVEPSAQMLETCGKKTDFAETSFAETSFVERMPLYIDALDTVMTTGTLPAQATLAIPAFVEQPSLPVMVQAVQPSQQVESRDENDGKVPVLMPTGDVVYYEPDNVPVKSSVPALHQRDQDFVENDMHMKDSAEASNTQEDPMLEEQLPMEGLMGEEPSLEQPFVEQPATEQPLEESPLKPLQVEELEIEQPSVEQPAAEQSTTKQSATEQRVVEQALSAESLLTPTEHQVMSEQLVVEQPVKQLPLASEQNKELAQATTEQRPDTDAQPKTEVVIQSSFTEQALNRQRVLQQLSQAMSMNQLLPMRTQPQPNDTRQKKSLRGWYAGYYWTDHETPYRWKKKEWGVGQSLYPWYWEYDNLAKELDLAPLATQGRWRELEQRINQHVKQTEEHIAAMANRIRMRHYERIRDRLEQYREDAHRYQIAS